MTLDEAKQELADPTGNSPHKVVEAARVLLDALRAAESQVANLSSQTTYDVRCPKCSSSMVRDTAQSGGAEAIRLRRESSGRVVMVEPYEPPDTAWLREWISRKPTKERDIYEKPIVDLCDAVDALLAMGATAPVPPARTSEPAAPTPGPMRGGGGGAGRDFPESERPVRVQGPTPGPTPRGGPETHDVTVTFAGIADRETADRVAEAAQRAGHAAYIAAPEVVAVSTFTAPFDAEAALVAFAEGLTHPTLPEAIHAPGQEIHAIREALFRGLAAGRRGAR